MATPCVDRVPAVEDEDRTRHAKSGISLLQPASATADTETVNEIAFVIAPYEFGIGRAIALEPVVDGVSVVDVYADVDGEYAYAGLNPPDLFLDHWRDVVAAGVPARVQLLGCGCGDSGCSWAAAQIEVGDDMVVWADLRGSDRAGEPSTARYPELGPYQFDRAQYAAALAAPQRAEAHTRQRHDAAALRAGVPSDPSAWLKAMTLTFGRDFPWPSQPHAIREIAAHGLRALIESGHPMTDEVVREWARQRRHTDENIKSCIERFRELTSGS